jgi:hypothetical protein
MSGIGGTLDGRILAGVIENEGHIHNWEKWFGLAASADAELHVADRMGPAIAPFQLIAGNLTWGSWVQILGTNDTPASTGMTLFDGHRVIVIDTDSVNPFIIQVVGGESAGIAAQLAAENFSEFPFVSGTNNNDSGITDIISHRIDVGTKVWARACCIGSNGSTIDLYFGIHEYIA